MDKEKAGPREKGERDAMPAPKLPDKARPSHAAGLAAVWNSAQCIMAGLNDPHKRQRQMLSSLC